MLYQRYMIYRVRSNCRLSQSNHKRRQRTRIALLALPLMTLCATGIYGSFSVSDSPQSAASVPPVAPKLPELTLKHPELASEIRAELAGAQPTNLDGASAEATPLAEIQAPAPVVAEPQAPVIATAVEPPAISQTAGASIEADAVPAIEALPPALSSAEAPATPAQPPEPATASVVVEATQPVVESPVVALAEAAASAPGPVSAPLPAPVAGDTLLTAVIQQIASGPEVAEESDEASLVDEDNIGSRWVEIKVQAGDNLPKIFARLNLPTSLLHEIVDSGKAGKALTTLRPGETFRVLLDPQHKMQELVYRRNALSSVQVTAEGEGFKVRSIDKPTTVQKTQVTGTITNSLYESAKKSGLSDRMILDMAQIFGWDIDFALEIQPGDRFSVIFDEEYVEGEKFRNGPILAAEFVNQGKVYRAYRFEEGDGHANYYNAEGKGMRKAFLRAPLDFLRVTSRFQKERYHPVLGVKRPHKGVDYGAPTGTPIYAAGDGKVEFAGSKSGYGNTIILQHGDQHSTLYGHLSKINAKVASGAKVKQGQVIGYVGATGLATGPHLHYEFRVKGEHRNPENIKLPNNVALEKAQKEKYRKSVATFASQLDKIAKTQVAEANMGQSRIQ